MEELKAQISSTSNFLTSIWGVLTIIGTIIAGVIGGYWWLQDSITERNAKVISQVAIDQIRAELDPLSTAKYEADRSLDSLERLIAESIALRYMNKSDSLGLVLLQEMNALDNIARKLDRIETRLDTDEMHKLDDQLARIWKHLQEKESQDSLLLDISAKMEEIKALNKARIENVKSGDRVR